MKRKNSNIVVRKHCAAEKQTNNHMVHMNDNHEIYIILKGDVTFSIDGRLYHLEPYDMLLISNQEIHCVIVNSECDYERIYIYFQPEYLRQFNTKDYNLLALFDHRDENGGNKIDHEVVRKYGLEKDFDQMLQYSKSLAPDSNVRMTSLLLKMLADINLAYEENRLLGKTEKEQPNQNDKINDIIRYISDNLTTKITLDDLTQKFFLSKYYLCHEFKRNTGFTVFDYIRYKRVLDAKMRLQNGQPISEVWCELGYVDYSNFYRTFKKTVGMSPKEYLEKLEIDRKKAMEEEKNG